MDSSVFQRKMRIHHLRPHPTRQALSEASMALCRSIQHDRFLTKIDKQAKLDELTKLVEQRKILDTIL